MPEESQKEIRIYTRGKGGRYYADFREYEDVGGSQEALVPDGKKYATKDPKVARKIADQRREELEGKRFNRDYHGSAGPAELEDYAAHHLERKALTSSVTAKSLGADEFNLSTAIDFFGPARTLQSIKVHEIEDYIAHLFTLPRGKDGGPPKPATVRRYLISLSNLYRRAQSEERVPIGYNPVQALMHKPSGKTTRAKWLEVDQAALFLEAARLYTPARAESAIPFVFEIIATFLLTGGRKQEVLALELGDISLDRNTVTFWENDYRGRKTRNADRVVPLWPQLKEILTPYLLRRATKGGTLLFPSEGIDGGQQPITDLRKALDAISATIGWEEGAVRTKMFRHTYCSARLQSLDRGRPVAPYTVAQELGHGGDQLVKKVYGHLGEIRHRIEGLEYIANDHRDRIGDQLASLRANAGASRRCKGVGFNGDPCRNPIRAGGGELCVWHDPQQADRAWEAREKHRRGTRRRKAETTSES